MVGDKPATFEWQEEWRKRGECDWCLGIQATNCTQAINGQWMLCLAVCKSALRSLESLIGSVMADKNRVAIHYQCSLNTPIGPVSHLHQSILTRLRDRPRHRCTGQQHFSNVGKMRACHHCNFWWPPSGKITKLTPPLRSLFSSSLPWVWYGSSKVCASPHNDTIRPPAPTQNTALTAAAATQHEDITTSVGTRPPAETVLDHHHYHPAASPSPMRTSRSEQSTNDTVADPVRARRQGLPDPHRSRLQPTHVQIPELGGPILPHI